MTEQRVEPTTTEHGTVEERLLRVEQQVDVLANAVRTLALGLEPHPTSTPGLIEAGRAASRAHEVLISGGL